MSYRPKASFFKKSTFPDFSISNATLNIALQNEWILDIIWQGITESVGVAVTQGSSTGTLKTMFQNEWTLNIVLQTITENVGVAVSQEQVCDA